MASTVRAMPLAQARDGDLVRVVAVRGVGREADALAGAGFVPGLRCTVTGRLAGGATVVGFAGRRLAIGADAAADIWVRLLGA